VKLRKLRKCEIQKTGRVRVYEGFGWALALSIRSGRQSAPWAGGQGGKGGWEYLGQSGPTPADSRRSPRGTENVSRDGPE
jgi:hypothetical protein